jgi:TrmH family RNA methyltransferase
MKEEIRSLQNARIKAVVRLLRDAAARREFGLTVVEGSREVARAVESGWTPEEVYVCPEQADETARALATDAEVRGARVFHCSIETFEKMSYRENPDGLLAVGPMAARGLDDLVLPKDALLLVTEKMEKPGNLGALLRTADGAGVDAVIVCDPATDLGNPNLIRASIGTVFYLPVALASSDDTVRWIKERDVRIVTTEPGAELLHTAADLTGSVAIVVGAEDAGLSAGWTSHADVRVRIPMLGRNDSLNVSAAAAILLYEAVRQRG